MITNTYVVARPPSRAETFDKLFELLTKSESNSRHDISAKEAYFCPYLRMVRCIEV